MAQSREGWPLSLAPLTAGWRGEGGLAASGEGPPVEVALLLFQVSNIVDSRQTVGLSTQEPGDVFTYFEFDGILGLAYPSLAAKDSVPVFDNMMKHHLVAQDLFSVYMSR